MENKKPPMRDVVAVDNSGTGSSRNGVEMDSVDLSGSAAPAESQIEGETDGKQLQEHGAGGDGATRQRWNSRVQFLFTCVGYAVGIGNVWRFPYQTYRFGGGAFLIPYLFSLFVFGIPLFVLELSIGQYFQMSVIKVYTVLHRRFRGVGYATVLTTFITGAYYTILLAWSLLFFFRCFAAEVPWGDDPQGFFDKVILNKSESINEPGPPQIFAVLALLLAITVVFLSVRHGVKSSGRASLVLVTVPYILLIILFFRAVTLEGAGVGIAYYLSPRWEKLLEADIWVQAATQIFFSLGPGFGMVIAFGSFLPPKEDIVKDSFIIALTNSATSLFAGFVVFGVLGHFSVTRGVPIEHVARAGPGLAFVVYPDSLSLLPAAVVFALAFFCMLFFLGVSSEVAWTVALISIIHEELKELHTRYPIFKKLKKTHVTLVVLSFTFLSSLLFTTRAGLEFMNLFDHYIPQFILLIVGLCESIAVGWVYGANRLRHEIWHKTGQKLGVVWVYLWKYVCPILLAVLIVFELIQEVTAPFSGYPQWAIALGWTISVIPAIPLLPFLFGWLTGDKHLDDHAGRAHGRLREASEAPKGEGEVIALHVIHESGSGAAATLTSDSTPGELPAPAT